MKVLILSQKFSVQLAERIQLLEEQGTEVLLLCFELNNRFVSRSFIFFAEPTNLASKLLFTLSLIKYFKWCDIVHWYGADIKHNKICLWLQKIFFKKGIIEFKKADVFIPEIEYNDNDEYRKKWFNNEKKPDGDYHMSLSVQKLFSSNSLIPLTEASLSQYILPDCFPPPYQFTSDIFPFKDESETVTSKNKDQVCVAVNMLADHLTEEIEALLTKMEAKYKNGIKVIRIGSGLIVDVSYAIHLSDIFIGSTVNGHYSYWDWYAFAKGKVVLTYVKPYFVKRYYKLMPMLVTDDLPLSNILPQLIEDKLLLENTQLKNKKYFINNFGKEKTIKELIEFYKKTAK